MRIGKKPLALLLAVLLTGCMNIGFEQELQRDGTSNLAAEVTIDIPGGMDEDNQDVAVNDFEEIKEELQEEYGERFGEDVQIEQLDNGYRILFTEFDLTQEVPRGDQLGAIQGETHTFEVDIGILTTNYRYEIPFTDELAIDEAVGNNETKEEGNNSLPETAESSIQQEIGLDEDMLNEEMLSQFLDLTYTVTVFADIDNTNGELQDERTVTFNLLELEEAAYIEFSENTVSGWFKSWF